MKRLLIFHYKDQLKPIGGPSGYLYNLMSGLQLIENPPISIEFLTKANGFSNSSSRARNIYNKLPLCIKVLYRIYGHWKGYRALKKHKVSYDSEFFSQFDYIHFHDCFSLYKQKDALNNYKGIIILQSHCPKPPQFEKIEDQYSPLERFLYGKSHLKDYTECVRFAFNRANYIIFPCKEAEESYYKYWDEYAKIHESRKVDIKYLPTGLKDCKDKIKFTREQVRTEYKIPQDAFVVSFVGRHNKVKGYDRLCRVACMLKNIDNLYVFVAGEEYPLKHPDHPRWIEVGWTNDPYSIINASDLFILPNQETYFDLVLIEVLSLGKAALVSKTGGNKYFENLESGIVYFETEDECASILTSLVNNKEKLVEMGAKNRHLYLEQFTEKKFGERYLKLISDLTVEKNN